MFILGGTCRLLSEIESGDRTVKRTRVVPINSQQSDSRQRNRKLTSTGQANNEKGRPGPTNDEPKPQQAGAHILSRRRDADDDEDGMRNTTARKKWAKINPKYNSVLSLLEK